MSKAGIFRVSVILLAILLLHCKKSTPGLNITLYNKPLSVIESYINGKWDLRYVHGGFALQTIQQSDYFWELTTGNRITENVHGVITADTVINWVRDAGQLINGDSTYLMEFSDKQTLPRVYVVDGIFNDTLVLHDNAVDGFYYHFTRSPAGRIKGGYVRKDSVISDGPFIEAKKA
jgi:hypothetical protein